MESLERSFTNITIDDGPWRQHDQTQPVWGNGGVQPGRVWGHVPVQFQGPTPWQEGAECEPNMNEALGLTSGASVQWGNPVSGTQSDYEKQIWSDPLNDQYFVPPQGTPDWPNGSLQTGSQHIWSDGGIAKDTDQFWKQQPPQQQQAQWGAPSMHAPWQPRQMGSHPNGPPPIQQGGPRGGPMLQQQQQQEFVGSWAPPPNGLRQKQQPMIGMWGDQQRMPGMPPRSGGRPQQQGRFLSGMQGFDVSVPPPMDMGHMGMGMRQIPPPGWKAPGVVAGAFNGGRHQYPQRGGMNQGGGGISTDPIWPRTGLGCEDDFDRFLYKNPEPDDMNLSVWHDPNDQLKKWQRDTGVSAWGDPEEQEDRKIRYWIVPEGEDEDLETALSRCPVPQKKVNKPEEGSRTPFPIPPRRTIIVTGWDDLPENDPNDPTKSGYFGENSPWANMQANDNPWYLPNQSGASGSFAIETTGSWVQGGKIPLTEASGDTSSQLQLAEMLKYAVDKGYLDISVTMSQNLPPQILQNVNNLLAKIPALESVETELKTLVDSARPSGEPEDNQNPQRFMNDVQKVEHNRLIIDVTTAKIEVQELSKKIHRALVEAGLIQPHQERVVPSTSEDYHYSFLESS